jgi:ubiquinone/menaquinone biosynthesis C-methylase UbiE
LSPVLEGWLVIAVVDDQLRNLAPYGFALQALSVRQPPFVQWMAMPHFRLPQIGFGYALLAVLAHAAAQEAAAPAARFYKGREIAQTMHYEGAAWLTRESRQREEDCETMLAALGVKPGQTVCDMGCGNGFYSLELARLVGENGKVLAVDIQREMLQMLKERAADEKITNIELVLGTIVDPKLPENSVDLMLMVDVYHEFSHPEEMLAAIRKSLKPNGRVALVEFRAEDPKVPIKPLHKMSKEQIMKEFPPNGFKLVEEFDELPWQHLMFFERDDAWQ